MKNRILLTFCLFITTYFSWSQYVIKDGSELLKLKKLPQEKAYIDHTGPLAFSGEYLYYSFFCFNAQNNKLSDISKIGYVALVDESNNYVFEHKIKLKNGSGSGDFFISTEIPSGRYKLLGYTQWMKNSGLSQVFKDDIIILNPYLVDQSTILEESEYSRPLPSKTGLRKPVLDSSIVSIVIDKNEYRPREKVSLSIKNYKNKLGYGAFTLKVSKIGDIPVLPSMNAIEYATSYFNADKKIPQRIGDSLFLPEQRGEMFFGNIKDSLTGEPIEGVPVIISVPGKEFLLKFSQTDQYGNFYSYLRKDYKNPMAVVQIQDEGRSYKIKKGKAAKLDISGLTFSGFELSKEYAENIKNRSILNQIENQFFTAKPDSIIQGDPIDPFDGGLPEVVVLDDYTRFPTFEETMVEVVEFSGYRNGGQDNDYVRVAQDFENYNEEYNSFPAIVLVDGVFIPDHEKIRNYDARKIEKIGLIRDQFRLGGKDYQGIVSVETFNGDFFDGYSAKNSLTVELNRPIPEKNYFTQTYSQEESKFSRIPDYRTLLFWKPKVLINGSSYDFEFFTSDIEGEYEIILNGFTTYGKPISVTRSIKIYKKLLD